MQGDLAGNHEPDQTDQPDSQPAHMAEQDPSQCQGDGKPQGDGNPFSAVWFPGGHGLPPGILQTGPVPRIDGGLP